MAGRQLPHRNQRRTAGDTARTRFSEGLIAVGTSAIALVCYYATLLPGLDLGDSASFQTGAGYWTLTPRQAYPLYYGLGGLFVWLHPGEPARAMNLASAVYGAGAVGVASWLALKVTDSAFAGAAAGLFLAFSYTFWSQAVTAEVYTLHLLIVGAALLAALAWADRPTTGRLAIFYVIYTLGFGNHLSMILLLPAFTFFLLLQRRAGSAGDPLRSSMIALAVGIAAVGAAQYAWNFRGMWTDLEPPASLSEGLAKFWFDVTKADWRESLVMKLSESGLQTRPSMYWFDLRQQFGVSGVVLAAIGAGYVIARWPRRGVLLLLVYLANLGFAWTYNVGDAYIFFLPSHYVIALCCGAGVAAAVALASRISNRTLAGVAGCFCLLYPLWRGYDTFPAVDRSRDNRAVVLLDQFTTRDGAAIYGVDTNWQVQNAVEYFMRERKPGTPWFWTGELPWLELGNVSSRFQELIDANEEINREVVVAPGVYTTLRSLGYESGTSDVRHLENPRVPGDLFSDRVMSTKPGTPYAFAILRPDHEYPIDNMSLISAWRWLTAGSMPLPDDRQFTIAIGRVGARPTLMRSEDRPYRLRTSLEPFEIDIRMESWLPTDTIRRAGFGHVIVNRKHFLTLERGVSFAVLGPGSDPLYSSGIYAPIPRYVLGSH
jgi:hypothetical protein